MSLPTNNPSPQLTPREKRLFKLLDVARYMSVEKDLGKLLEFIAHQVTGALEAERCGIFLLDEERDEIWSKIALGEKQEIRFPKGSGIAGRTIDTGQAILIPDAYQSPHFNKTIDEKTGFKTRDILCIPMTNLKEKTIGCFQLINKVGGTFDEDDRDYLIAFASQAAVEIESAQLHQQQEKIIDELCRTQEKLHQKMKQLQVIYELEKEANEFLSIESFMKLAINKTIEVTNSQAGSILLINNENGMLTFRHGAGKGVEKLANFSMDLTEGIAGQVIKTGKSILDNDVANNTNHCKKVDEILRSKTQNIVTIPLRKIDPSNSEKEEITGVIEILNNTHGSYSKEDQEFAELISAQISSFIYRKNLTDEKQRSQRLSTIGQLASTIFHDFKNPMSAIRGMAEILTNPKLTDEKKNHLAKMIAAQVDRCTNMTKEILCFARGESSYSFEDTDAQAFFKEMGDILDMETERLKVQFDKDFSFSGKLHLDVDKMKRVIFNLTNNALEMLKEGDKLSLSARLTEEDCVEIRISDTGPGIPESLRANLFDAFVTQGKKGGTGLGLHIAKEIIEKHNGKIFLDEKVPQGASFVIHLKPLEDELTL